MSFTGCDLSIAFHLNRWWIAACAVLVVLIGFVIMLARKLRDYDDSDFDE